VGDVAKAFSVVKTLTENPTLLKTLSDNTKKKVDTEYRADLFATAMLSAFKSAISRPLT
jgi:hypothetical protein